MSNNPYLLSQLCVMQEKEKSRAYQCSDYMSLSNSMCPDDRLALCIWSYKVVASCNDVRPATVVIAIVL